jgi:hypothetical protein
VAVQLAFLEPTGTVPASRRRSVLPYRPAVIPLGALVERREVGRPADIPPYLLLGHGVLARVFRSGARVEVELAQPGTWSVIVDTVEQMRRTRPELEIAAPPRRAPGWDAYRYAHNRRFTAEGVLEELCEEFTELAVAQAQDAGLHGPRPPPGMAVGGGCVVVVVAVQPGTGLTLTNANGVSAGSWTFSAAVFAVSLPPGMRKVISPKPPGAASGELTVTCAGAGTVRAARRSQMVTVVLLVCSMGPAGAGPSNPRSSHRGRSGRFPHSDPTAPLQRGWAPPQEHLRGTPNGNDCHSC